MFKLEKYNFDNAIAAHKEINEQELLAMIVYKNLYPQDFAKIYLKKGLLYTVFKNKELFTVGLTADFKELAKVAETSMAEARRKIVEIRKQYVAFLGSWKRHQLFPVL